MKAIARKTNLLIWTTILFLGAFAPSNIGTNIAKAAQPEIEWNQHIISFVGTQIRAVFAIDMDNDGDNDVVAINSNWVYDHEVAWYENLGGCPPLWNQHIIATFPSEGCGLSDLFAIDVDEDNDADVMTAAMGWSNCGHELAWYQNALPSWITRVIPQTKGMGTYSKEWYAPSVFADDINDDTYVDIVWGGYSYLAWYENDGDLPPSWTEHFIPNSLYLNTGVTVFATDINSDDNIDVLAGTPSAVDAKIAWYENDGGTVPIWTEHIISNSTTYSLFAIDMDGDSDIDVVSGGMGGLVWYENRGGIPTAWTEHIVNPAATDFVYAIDMDCDNDIDVVRGDPILWYENLGGSPPAWDQHFIFIVDAQCFFPISIDTDEDIDVVAGSGISLLLFENWKCGDVNGDCGINSADIVFLINCIFVPGAPCPCPEKAGDCNSDGVINSADIVCLINYLFVPGSPPPGC